MQISKKVEFKVQAEAIGKVKQLIVTFLQAIAAHEKGETLFYKSFCLAAEDTRFIHLMIFKDELAELQHKDAAHTQAFVKELYPLCAEEPVFANLVEVSSF